MVGSYGVFSHLDESIMNNLVAEKNHLHKTGFFQKVFVLLATIVDFFSANASSTCIRVIVCYMTTIFQRRIYESFYFITFSNQSFFFVCLQTSNSDAKGSVIIARAIDNAFAFKWYSSS
jgi:hypothetical protein